MKNSTNSIIMKLSAGFVFFLAFLALSKSGFENPIQIKLIFRHITVPLYQWILIFGFLGIWKIISKEPWAKIIVNGLAFGLITCLYFPLLDTLKQVWGGAPLSRIYVLYINGFSFCISSLLLFWGAFIVRSTKLVSNTEEKSFFSNILFFPVLLLGVYGICFYFLSGHAALSAALVCLLVFSFFILGQKTLIAKVSGAALKIKAKLSDPKTLCLLIFVFALIMRLIFLSNLLSIEGDSYPLASDDGDAYNYWGQRGSADFLLYFSEAPHQFMIFYAMMLSLIYSIFGHSYIAVGVIQSVIGALLCVFVFILAYRVTGKRFIAVLAALGVAINSPLILLATTINTEALYLPLLTAFVLALLFYLKTGNDKRAPFLISFAGLILGLAVVVRELALGIFALALLWVLVWGRAYVDKKVVRRIRDGVLLFVFMLIPIFPITYTNYANTGEFCLLYKRNAISWKLGSAWGEELVPSNKGLVEIGIIDPASAPLKSIAAAVTSPGQTIRELALIVPRRMRNFFFWSNFGTFDPVFLINNSIFPNKYASSLEFYTILLFFASILMFLLSRLESALKGLVLMIVVYYTMFHGILYLSQGARYRSPIEPFMAIVVSFGIYQIFKLFGSANKEMPK